MFKKAKISFFKGNILFQSVKKSQCNQGLAEKKQGRQDQKVKRIIKRKWPHFSPLHSGGATKRGEGNTIFRTSLASVQHQLLLPCRLKRAFYFSLTPRDSISYPIFPLTFALFRAISIGSQRRFRELTYFGFFFLFFFFWIDKERLNK